MCFAVFDTRFKRKLLFIVSAVAATVLLAVLLAFCFSGDSQKNSGYIFNLEKTGGAGGFLAQFSLDYESCQSSRELTLPQKNDRIFVQYNVLQSKIGLNVLKFAGKRVEERYLKLKNKDEKGRRLYAVLYIYKEKVVAAHLTTLCEGSENLPLALFG